MNRTVFKTTSLLLVLLLSVGLWLGAAPRCLQAQTDETPTEVNRINGRYFGKMAIDFGKVVTSPLHWKGNDFLVFGVAAGTTVLIYALADHGIREWVEDNQKTSFTNFSLVITHLGEAPFLLGLSTLLYAGGEAFKSNSLRKTALLSLESLAINGIVVTAVKYILGRSRPLTGDGSFSFHWFRYTNHEHAFPSGHASSAFAIAAVIAGQSESFAVGALAYGLASLVAISRVTNNEHWASDVVAGSLFGYFIGKEVLALNRPGSKDKPTLSFAPGPGGFSLSLRF